MDLEEALNQANELALSFKEEALRAILAARSMTLSSSSENASPNADLHKLVQEIHREDELAQMMEQPSQAWSLLVHDEVLNSSQKAQLVQIAEAWVLEDGFGVLMDIFDDLRRVDDLYVRRDPHEACKLRS